MIFRKPKKKLKPQDPEGQGSRLKVLIATGIYPPDIGGPATYAKNLAKELVKIGVKVKVLTYSDEQGGKRKESSVHRIIRKKNILIRYYNYFRQACFLVEKADVVYILDLMSAGFPGIVAAKIHHKKVIFRTGGDFLWEKAFQDGWTDLPLREYYKGKKRLKENLLFWFCKILLKRIDLILFSTQLQAGIYKDYDEAFSGLEKTKTIEPDQTLKPQYEDAYQNWLKVLKLKLNNA